MQSSELKALISLLEDSQLADHVESKILEFGYKAIPYLELEWEKYPDQGIQSRIETLIHTLQFKLTKDRLKSWKEKDPVDLLNGLWILATYRYPDLEFAQLNRQLDQVYQEVWLEFRLNLDVLDQIKIINRVLFDKLKFTPNNKNFYSPENSFLNVVLETRRGNPISLCMVYLLVAQRLKLPIYGVNLPNLFMLLYLQDHLPIYINVFNKGLVFSQNDIENYIQELHIPPQSSYFEPCEPIDIIRRHLQNLILAFEKSHEHKSADEIKELLASV